MRMGPAFTEMEKHKADLGVEDYSVAQPTLEQVFIRTVVTHSVDPTQTVMNPLLRDSLSMPTNVTGGIQPILDEHGELIAASVPTMHDNDQMLEYKAEVNICGCTKFVMQVCIGVLVAFILLFFGIAFGTRSTICFGLAVLCLVASIVFCVIYCCPCCQPAKGVDE
jgi:hypothetical protein